MSANRRLADTTDAAVALLAVMAQAGHTDEASARRAFAAGIAGVFPQRDVAYRPPADPQRALDEAWPLLDRVEPLGKALLLEGLVNAVSHDGRVSLEESELLRVVCASLHVPLPPMSRGITDASTTRSPATPRTRSCGSTTASSSSAAPIRHVPTGW